MATRVYLSTGEIIVDKTGEPPVLNIPVSRAEYIFYSLRPNNTNEQVDYNRVSIGDIVTEESRLDDVTEIQDSGGTPIGDFAAVKAYLDSIIDRGSTRILEQDATTLSGTNLDAAGAIRVAQKTVLGSYVQHIDELPDFYHRVNNGTATQIYSNEVVTMSSGSGYAICQTYKRHLYLAGFSQSPEVTFNDFGNEADVIKRAGYFSSSTVAPYTASLDGFFLESDGSTHRLRIFKNGTESPGSPIERSNWDDPMDGTGVSGVNLDFDNFTVVEWQFLYLGGTALEMFFNVGGTLYKAHTYQNSGVNASTFIGSPVQPIRFEIRNNGAAGTMGQICAGVSTGGALGVVGFPRSADTAVGTFSNCNATATQYLICGIRCASPRAVGFDISAAATALTNDSFTLRLLLNPTYTDVVPTWNALGNSNFEYALADTVGVNNNTVTGGTVLATSYVSNQVRSGVLEANSLFQPGVDLDGTYDEVVLAVEPSTTNLDIKGAINFKVL